MELPKKNGCECRQYPRDDDKKKERTNGSKRNAGEGKLGDLTKIQYPI